MNLHNNPLLLKNVNILINAPVIWLLFSLIALKHKCYAQFYYNDIICNHDATHQYELWKKNGITKTKTFHYGPTDTLIAGFSITQDMDFAHDIVTNRAEIPEHPVSVSTNYYKNDKLVRIEESSENINTITQYTYSEKGQQQQVVSTTSDTAMKFANTEAHIWQYGSNNLPIKMLKQKNGKLFLEVEFKLDSAGLIGEEHCFSGEKETNVFYYFYDQKHQLTDIARYNERFSKIEPVMVFSYAPNGNIDVMRQRTNIGTDFLTWKYTYKEDGLKDTETCFGNNHILIGKVVYGYQR